MTVNLLSQLVLILRTKIIVVISTFRFHRESDQSYSFDHCRNYIFVTLFSSEMLTQFDGGSPLLTGCRINFSFKEVIDVYFCENTDLIKTFP
jgi:hypothetical protein